MNYCNSPPPVAEMQAYVAAGLTTFDMADIYGPAEEIFGLFNNQVETRTAAHSCKKKSSKN